MGILRSQYKDPVMNNTGFECHRWVLITAHLSFSSNTYSQVCQFHAVFFIDCMDIDIYRHIMSACAMVVLFLWGATNL